MHEKRKRKSLVRLKEYIPVYLMAIPGLVYLIINNYMPMFGLWMTFTKVNFRKGMFGGDFVGLKNFQFLFASSDAFVIFRNTIGYGLLFLIIGPITAITVAIFLNEIRKAGAKKAYQTIILLPHLISMVVVSYLVYTFLNTNVGILNKVITMFGGEPIRWYGEAKYWPFILPIVHIWKGVGFSSIIYLSTIVGISDDYYEAAALDGCTRLQQIRYITLPLLKPTVITLTIMGVGGILHSDFGLFYQVPLNQGALIPTTQTLDTYVLRGLMELGNTSMSAAAGFFQSVVGFFMIMTTNAIVKKVSADDSLF